jgi:undecaprenyl diphosphate synthase
MRLCLAVNYGGRAEITAAARRLARQAVAGEVDPEAIDESLFAASLETAGMPDPDLLIRTAGELRISNFLLWQVSYAELWVTERTWPEFTAADLDEAITAYRGRERRFGGLKTS